MAVPSPSRVFPLPGWTGPIDTHHGAGVVGGSDLMVAKSGVQPVVSMVSGTVEYISTEATAPNSGGNAIQIRGIDGLAYYYAHLATPIPLKKGETVKAGQLLGMAGNTGNAKTTPPHLHIGIGKDILTGLGATGGTGGGGINAVAMLRALVSNPVANNASIASKENQTAIGTGQGAGTIALGAAPFPLSQSLADRIKWLAGLLNEAGVDPSKIPTMVAISLAENRSSDPASMSKTNDLGLWQINIPSWTDALKKAGIIKTVADLKDPIVNAKAAAFVLNAQGLTAWATFNAGTHNQFTTDVANALAGIDLGGGLDTPIPQPGDNPCDCPNVQYGPVTLPDLGCSIGCAISKVIEEWKKRWTEWWSSWTSAHAANIGFVIVGTALVLLSVAALITENKQARSVANNFAGPTAAVSGAARRQL